MDVSELRGRCKSGNSSPRLLFDYLGRPYCFSQKDTTGDNRFKYLLREKTKIYLFYKSNPDKKIAIEISPITGFIEVIE
jgi:hypothetical protein